MPRHFRCGIGAVMLSLRPFSPKRLIEAKFFVLFFAGRENKLGCYDNNTLLCRIKTKRNDNNN